MSIRAALADSRILAGTLVLVAIGSFAPWATVDLLGVSIDTGGGNGDGVLTAIAAVVVALAFFAEPLVGRVGFWDKRRGTVALVFAVAALVIAGYDFLDIADNEIASVGWGLYLTLIASVVMVAAVSVQRSALPVTAP